MKEKTVVFIGHRDCMAEKERVRETLVELVAEGYTDFLTGEMGDFDILCSSVVTRLKPLYPQIKLYLVIPYYRQKQYLFPYDEIIFPEEVEGVFYKSAIVKRNRFMVRNASCAVCYVKYRYGGAVQTLQYARKNGLRILNLAE